MPRVRFVVCVDVQANDLKEGYSKLCDALGELPKGIEWESTDEAYDTTGELVGPGAVQRAAEQTLGLRPGLY